ncbi:MAG: hypothetical protein EHM39_09325 [Chloroflexi bacterium]|nr:MAG: hypothetical protein EHM39_09325 [Chloroflexota bacterium]
MIMRPRPGTWESVRIGAGGPPFKTDAGWLNFYHGYNEAHVYCLGLALHDLHDPAKILNRQDEPILCPMAPWELFGDVPNVVFTCGGIETETDYLIYYGGGDHVMAVASVSKEDIAAFLKGG